MPITGLQTSHVYGNTWPCWTFGNKCLLSLSWPWPTHKHCCHLPGQHVGSFWESIPETMICNYSIFVWQSSHESLVVKKQWFLIEAARCFLKFFGVLMLLLPPPWRPAILPGLCLPIWWEPGAERGTSLPQPDLLTGQLVSEHISGKAWVWCTMKRKGCCLWFSPSDGFFSVTNRWKMLRHDAKSRRTRMVKTGGRCL